MKELVENNRDKFKKKLHHVMAESEERASSLGYLSPMLDVWRLNQLASVVYMW